MITMLPRAPKPLLDSSKAVLDTQDDDSRPEDPFLDPLKTLSGPGRSTITKDIGNAASGEPIRGIESDIEFLRQSEKKKRFARSTTDGQNAAQNMKARVVSAFGWKNVSKEDKKLEKERREKTDKVSAIAAQTKEDVPIPTVAADPASLRAKKPPPPRPPKLRKNSSVGIEEGFSW